jgi:hypothetical protein
MIGGPIHGENRPLLTNDLVGFEKQPVEVHQDFRKYTDHSEEYVEYTSNQ